MWDPSALVQIWITFQYVFNDFFSASGVKSCQRIDKMLKILDTQRQEKYTSNI